MSQLDELAAAISSNIRNYLFVTQPQLKYDDDGIYVTVRRSLVDHIGTDDSFEIWKERIRIVDKLMDNEIVAKAILMSYITSECEIE